MRSKNHIKLGHACYKSGDYQGSIEHYKAALNCTIYPRAYFYVGRSLRKLGKFEEACVSFEKAIAHGMETVELLINYADVLILLKKFEEAVVICDKNITLNPDNALMYCNRGLTLSCLQRYDEALEAFSMAIQHNPNFSEAYFNRGNILRMIGNPEQAIVNYLLAEKCDKNKKIHIPWNQFDKNAILAAIKLLPLGTQIELIPDCLQGNSPSGKYLYFKRGLFECRPNQGTLRELNKHYEAILKRYKDSETAWFTCASRLVQSQVLPKELCALITLFYYKSLGFSSPIDIPLLGGEAVSGDRPALMHQ